MTEFSLKQANARGVAERWRRQYQRPKDGWTNAISGSSKAIYEALVALGDDPPVLEVNKIIGNKSWTCFTCSVCTNHVTVAATADIGDEELTLCRSCVAEIARLDSLFVDAKDKLKP